MRHSVISLFIALIASSIFSYSQVQAFDVPVNTTAHIYFSPDGGGTDAIVSELS